MRQIKKGSTNKSVDLYIIDSTDGTPETGVLHNTAGIDLKYRREGSAVVSVTEVTLAALTTVHTDGGFLEIGNGSYRFDPPDAAYATGADKVTFFGTVTGMVILPVEIQLVDFDPEDTVRLGLTALPNAAADAAGGVPISDTGGLDLDARLDAAISSRSSHTAANVTTDMDANSADLDTIIAYVDELESRLTALRAGYLDNLSGGAVALNSVASEARLAELDAANIPADIDAIPTTPMRGTDNALLASSAPTNFSSLVITVGGAIDALVQGYLNTLLTETTSGRIAGNIDTFFENSDAATTKTVDDVGVAGSGLTQQNIRDAMKLAPTAGAPIAGSVDEHLDDILADSNELQLNQGNWLTATGFSTHSAADVRTAMEADGTDLHLLIEALVNKIQITESSGDAEVFNDAGVSQGTVIAAFTSVAGVTKRERMVA